MRILLFGLAFSTFFGGTAFAALTTQDNPIYVTAGKSLNLVSQILGGTGKLTFTKVAGYYGTITKDGLYTAPERVTTTKITVKDSSVPQQVLTFNVVSPALSLRVANLVMVPGATKEIIIDGGVPEYRCLPSENFTQAYYNKYFYTAPKLPGNYSFTVTDKISSSTKTVNVEVVPLLKSSVPSLSLRANTGASYSSYISGGKIPYTCKVENIVGNCDGTRINVGATTGKGSLVIRDSSDQEVRIELDVAAMSLSTKSLLVAPGESKAISIYGGVSPYSSSSASATISSGTISYLAPSNPASFTITDSATNKASIVVDVVRKLDPVAITMGTNSGQALSVIGGRGPFIFTKVSGVGSVSTAGLFSSNTVGSATINVKDSYSPAQSANFTVNVINPPAVTLSVSKTSITAGEKVTLSWSHTDATELMLDGVDVTGKSSQEVGPTSTKTYTLVAKNALASVVKNITVNVVTAPTALSGDYIASEYAPGCVPETYGDVFDKARGHQRRIEPKDCEIVRVSRPSFVWRLVHGTTSYQLVLTKGGTSTTFETTVPRYLHQTDLSNGDYTWQVIYLVNGRESTRSEKRRFSVIIKNPNFKIPSGQELVIKVLNKGRPRALPNATNFGAVINRAKSVEAGYQANYQAYLSEIAKLASENIPALVNKTAIDFENNDLFLKYINAVKQFTIDEREKIEWLGYGYYLDKNASYLESGIKRVLNLASLDPLGVSSEKNQDQANREVILGLAIGLDLFGNHFSATDRSFIISRLQNRMAQVKTEIIGLNNEPYKSHVLTAVHYVTEALMYLVGLPDYPTAASELQTMWEYYVTIGGTWGGQVGGYANGTSYSWYTLGTVARSLAAIKLIANVNMHEYEPHGNIGLNQISQTIPGVDSRGIFGDEVEEKRHFYVWAPSNFRLLANLTRRQDYEWYWRMGSVDNNKKALHPFHYLLLGAYSTLPIAPPSTLAVPNHFVFEDAGFIAVHSDTKRSDRSSVFFRSSRFGAFNHSHADNNSFNFVSKGKDILVSAGYYPNSENKHYLEVGKASRYKNVLTFDGGIGQSESELEPIAPTRPIGIYRDLSAKLTDFKTDGDWTIMSGDATDVYQGFHKDTFQFNKLLTAAYRTVAYHRSLGLILIYDFATSDKNRSWELNFHSIVRPVIPYSNGLRISNAPGSACIDVIAPNGEMTTTSGFPVAPLEKPNANELIRYADQYHSKYKVLTPSMKFVALTIIREGCGAAPSRLPQSGNTFTVTAGGRTIVFDTKGARFQ